MQVVNSAPDGEQGKVIDTAFYVLDPAELNNAARHVPYPLETLKTSSQKQWALMELRDSIDLPILQKSGLTAPFPRSRPSGWISGASCT